MLECVLIQCADQIIGKSNNGLLIVSIDLFSLVYN